MTDQMAPVISCPFCGNTEGLQDLQFHDERECSSCGAALRQGYSFESPFADRVDDAEDRGDDLNRIEVLKGVQVDLHTDQGQPEEQGDPVHIWGYRVNSPE